MEYVDHVWAMTPRHYAAGVPLSAASCACPAMLPRVFFAVCIAYCSCLPSGELLYYPRNGGACAPLSVFVCDLCSDGGSLLACTPLVHGWVLAGWLCV